MPQITSPTIQVKVLLRSSARHLSQIFTGLGLLEKEKKIRVRFEKSDDYFPDSPQRLRIIINDSINTLFDLRDAANIDSEDFNWSDYYFKRSYSNDQHLDIKIHPLGFYYQAYGKEDHSKLFLRYSLAYYLEHPTAANAKLAIRKIIRSNAVLAQLANQDVGQGVADFRKFECQPFTQNFPRIIYQIRLWDPDVDGLTEIDKKEILEINNMRLSCLYLLQKEFGDRFTGGLVPNHYSIEKYPDLILTRKMAIKSNYVKNLSNSSICIATRGLFNSNGAKFGEYIAGAKAIVSEHPRFSVPGDFNDGKNFLGFINPEECVEKVHYLMDNPDKRYEMMMNNLHYYHQYLRPDRLVWNAISKAIAPLQII
jgi:hypothetical protein